MQTSNVDGKLKVVKVSNGELIEATYERMFLERQKIAITEQKERENALRDAELVEVEFLISECEKNGVKMPKKTHFEINDPLNPNKK